MIRNFLLICLLGCGISLATAGNPPFFTTGTAVNEKGELLMTGKLCSVRTRLRKLPQEFYLMVIKRM